MKEITEKLIRIQSKLTVPKSRHNSFGDFDYRNGDDILKAVKPLCKEEGLLIILTDSVIEVGGRVYVKASAILSDGNDSITVDSFAREEEKRPKMAEPMLTGSASSYARKYAMNGLFGLDDDSDPDNLNNSHVGSHQPVNNDSITPAQTKQLRAIADGMKETNLDGWKYIMNKIANGLTSDEAQKLINRGSKG